MEPKEHKYSQVNIRDDLNEDGVKESGKRTFLYIATCTVNIAAFTCGLSFGWTSPIIPKLRELIDNPLPTPILPAEESWVGSLLPVGAAIGPFAAGYAADRIGRKNTLLLSTLPIIVAFLMSAYADSVLILYLARFLCGISVGGIFTVLPMYVGEIAEDEVRGSLGSFMQLFIVIGLLFSFCIGPYIDIKSFNLLCMIPPILFMTIFYMFIPETAHYLLAKKDFEGAEASLMKLRSKSKAGVTRELNDIRLVVEESMSKQGSFLDIFKSVGLKKAFILSVGLVALQQFSGINVILFYTQSIFAATGSTLPPDVSTIVIGVVQVVASLLTPMLVDRKGKRFLLILSAVSMGISQCVLGLYFYLKDSGKDLQSVFWLPVACLVIYMIGYCLGFGPLPWAVMGELFPAEVKSIASTVTASGCWVLAFILTKFFSSLVVVIGNGGSFWLFSGFCAVGVIFVFRYLPETSGKSLQEIQDILSGETK